MGGAVSSGHDNHELIDNLMGGGYIRTRDVERVFRAVDRADYMSAEARNQAYKDLAWRNGLLHLSAPCIYSEVMEALELRPGLSFLNLGSGTGYLSTLAGLILGPSGISHGVDCYPTVIEYANKKLNHFLENSIALDEFDFCAPKYFCGDALSLAPLAASYDRVYCGAGVVGKYENYFKQLIKVGGVLVMPLRERLVQVRRVAAAEWRTRKLLNVSFALLRPTPVDEPLKLEELRPATLAVLCRGVIRATVRRAIVARSPELGAESGAAAGSKAGPRRAEPRRLTLPLDGDPDDAEGLNELHDLDQAGGANEMNALLSLVLSMGQNRVAGSLRLDTEDDFHSDSDFNSTHSEDENDDNDRSNDRDGDNVDNDRSNDRESDNVDDRSNDRDGDNVDNDRRNDREGDNVDNDSGSDNEQVEPEVNPPVRNEPEPLRGRRHGSRGSGVGSRRPCLRAVRLRRLPTDENSRPGGEVEVYLGSSSSPSIDDSSSSDDEEERRGSKRQKLDSGIGEGGSDKSDKSSNDGEASEREARRLSLSVAMKRAVLELPLPPALKVYVNLGRELIS